MAGRGKLSMPWEMISRIDMITREGTVDLCSEFGSRFACSYPFCVESLSYLHGLNYRNGQAIMEWRVNRCIISIFKVQCIIVFVC